MRLPPLASCHCCRCFVSWSCFQGPSLANGPTVKGVWSEHACTKCCLFLSNVTFSSSSLVSVIFSLVSACVSPSLFTVVRISTTFTFVSRVITLLLNICFKSCQPLVDLISLSVTFVACSAYFPSFVFLLDVLSSVLVRISSLPLPLPFLSVVTSQLLSLSFCLVLFLKLVSPLVSLFLFQFFSSSLEVKSWMWALPCTFCSGWLQFLQIAVSSTTLPGVASRIFSLPMIILTQFVDRSCWRRSQSSLNSLVLWIYPWGCFSAGVRTCCQQIICSPCCPSVSLFGLPLQCLGVSQMLLQRQALQNYSVVRVVSFMAFHHSGSFSLWC